MSVDQRRKRGFYIHLTTYILVNALLVGINLAITPDRLWVKWPLMGWGIGIVAHAAAVFTFAKRV
jgi:2TM domain